MNIFRCSERFCKFAAIHCEVFRGQGEKEMSGGLCKGDVVWELMSVFPKEARLGMGLPSNRPGQSRPNARVPLLPYQCPRFALLENQEKQKAARLQLPLASFSSLSSTPGTKQHLPSTSVSEQVSFSRPWRLLRTHCESHPLLSTQHNH